MAVTTLRGTTLRDLDRTISWVESSSASPITDPGFGMAIFAGIGKVPLQREEHRSTSIHAILSQLANGAGVDSAAGEAAARDLLKIYETLCQAVASAAGDSTRRAEIRNTEVCDFRFALFDNTVQRHWRLQSYTEDDESKVSCVKLDPDAETPQRPVAPPALVFDTFDMNGVAKYIKEKHVKNILVMCGAGISVDAGIPDFRTPGTGLYSNLQKYNLPYPEAAFTLDYLEENPEVFFEIARDMNLWPGSFAPTLAHHFIKILDDEGLLLRNYTQNIDCLERVAGLREEKLVEAHGSFAAAHCMAQSCRTEVPTDVVRACAEHGDVPRCPKCSQIVKPDVIFFGETLPEKFRRCVRSDAQVTDMLLVIGTSLTVTPFCLIPELVRKDTPRVLINMNRVGDFLLLHEGEPPQGGLLYRDVFLPGSCQSTCVKLAEKLGFKNRLLAAYEATKCKIMDSKRKEDDKPKATEM